MTFDVVLYVVAFLALIGLPALALRAQRREERRASREQRHAPHSGQKMSHDEQVNIAIGKRASEELGSRAWGR